MGWENYGYDCGRDRGFVDKSRFPTEIIVPCLYTVGTVLLFYLIVCFGGWKNG
jgi:hypothetical protein